MRSKVFGLFKEGAESGALQAAIDSLDPKKPPVLTAGKFQGYYGKFYRSMPPSSWASINSKFPSQKPLKQLDLTHVQALHRELEQLAKDRAALMAQVNLIRGKVEEVGQENQKLASEVLSRPLSPHSDRQKHLTAKYGAG